MNRFAVLIVGGLLAAGCASFSRPPVPYAAVGPVAADESPSAGILVVYTAFEVSEPGPNDPGYRRYHAAYRLFGQDGHLIERVVNRAGATGEEPVTLRLAPGRYRVEGPSNGRGIVSVPVVVEAGKPTVVHLEGPIGLSGGGH